MKFHPFKIIVLFALFSLEIHASWESAFLEKVHRGERPSWMIEQITKDLQPFVEKGITKEDLEEVMRFDPDRVLRSEIRDNIVNLTPDPYLKSVGDGIGSSKSPVFAVFFLLPVIQNTLSQLAKLVPLPYLDFIINFDDAAYIRPEFVSCKGPILSFAKLRNNNGTILIPDWEALNNCHTKQHNPCYEDALQQVSQAKIIFPWHLKIDKAFWRGTNSGTVLKDDLSVQFIKMNKQNYEQWPRNQLVHFSLNHPNLLNARFNRLIQGDKKARAYFEENGYLGNGASIIDHLQYKYQILIDGFTCAYAGAYWRLFSDAVILKQTSPALQWYYGLLKPYVHYIPFAYDLSDLEEKINWARSHDEEVMQIIQNANAMANRALHYEDIMLYLYLLLTEYAKLQRF